MVRLRRSGGVFRSWHAWREASKNLGDPRQAPRWADRAGGTGGTLRVGSVPWNVGCAPASRDHR